MATTDTNIIRKIEVVEKHGHHGGAWKVAYADFMTAMMAFFLLLWILSSSDEQKLRGIAEYFTNATMPGGSGVLDGATLGPPGTLNASNGAIVARGSELGQVDDSHPNQWETKDVTATADPRETSLGSNEGDFENPAAGAPSETLTVEQMREADAARFDALEEKLRQSIQEHPDLRPLAENVIFERTPEGMRIQIVDLEGKPMFASGSAAMSQATLMLMEKLGQGLIGLPNDMVIAGHTDSIPFSGNGTYDNWDLSSDRANAMRRVLQDAGVDAARIDRVSGVADTDLLKPDAPRDPSNRRVTVLLNYLDVSSAPPPADNAEISAPKAGLATVSSQQAAETYQNASVLDANVMENLRSALR